ncbi:hypothetical protein MMC29_004913 [Sticta canariensis]|nr:hypothetical protein [Sticta canariensis]
MDDIVTDSGFPPKRLGPIPRLPAPVARRGAWANAEAASIGRLMSGARRNTAAPSSEATKARKHTNQRITPARSSKAAVASLLEASSSNFASTIPQASLSTTAANVADTSEPSRHATKRKAATEATSTVAKSKRTKMVVEPSSRVLWRSPKKTAKAAPKLKPKSEGGGNL